MKIFTSVSTVLHKIYFNKKLQSIQQGKKTQHSPKGKRIHKNQTQIWHICKFKISKFKISIINVLRVNQIQDLKDNFSREDEAIRKNKMEVLEMKI